VVPFVTDHCFRGGAGVPFAHEEATLHAVGIPCPAWVQASAGADISIVAAPGNDRMLVMYWRCTVNGTCGGGGGTRVISLGGAAVRAGASGEILSIWEQFLKSVAEFALLLALPLQR